MIELILVIVAIALFVSIELVYFKLADRFSIIDQPNSRSSHSVITIRGGGIIFPIALLLYPIYSGHWPVYFLTGLFLISLVSFIDDMQEVNSKLRLFIHLLAVALMFYQLDLFGLPWYIMLFAFFFTIGTINAINFMDGINGITGGYGLITLLTLWGINQQVVKFTDGNLLLITALALAVFNFFNFRTRAKCFAGDVGSVSLGFIIVYFMLTLILQTGNFNYVLLLLVYGLDVVTTICFRILRKERVLEAHRSHFYQFLHNSKGISQLSVAAIYILLQFSINFLLIISGIQSGLFTLIILVVSGIVFVKLRFIIEGAERLLIKP